MAENELELVLKLGDQLSPKLREIMNTLKAASESRQVKDTESGFDKIGKSAAKAGAEIKASFISPTLAKFGIGVGIAGITAAAVAATSKLNDMAKSERGLRTLSERTNIAKDSLKAMKMATDVFGVSTEELGGSIAHVGQVVATYKGGLGGRSVQEAAGLREGLRPFGAEGDRMWHELSKVLDKKDALAAYVKMLELVAEQKPEHQARLLRTFGIPEQIDPKLMRERIEYFKQVPRLFKMSKEGLEDFNRQTVILDQHWSDLSKHMLLTFAPALEFALKVADGLLVTIDKLKKLAKPGTEEENVQREKDVGEGKTPYQRLITNVYKREATEERAGAEQKVKDLELDRKTLRKSEAVGTDDAWNKKLADADERLAKAKELLTGELPAEKRLREHLAGPPINPSDQIKLPATPKAVEPPPAVAAPEPAVEPPPAVAAPEPPRGMPEPIREKTKLAPEVQKQRDDRVLSLAYIPPRPGPKRRAQAIEAHAAGLDPQEFALGGLSETMRAQLADTGRAMSEEGVKLGITEGYRPTPFRDRARGMPAVPFGEGMSARVNAQSQEYIARHPELGLTPSARGEPGSVVSDKLSDVLRAERLSREVGPRSNEPMKVEGDATLTVDVNAPRGTKVGLKTRGMFKNTIITRSSQMNLAPIDGDDVPYQREE